MKLGVAYNVFDGMELLLPSIKTVRDSAAFVCVVYQETSNFGEHMSESDRYYLKELDGSGMVDEFINYNPPKINGHFNEINKRNIGLNSCLAADCSHFMSMDADEFYLRGELSYAIKKIDECGADSSACKMQTYYKSAKYVLDPPEEYFVPLIYKLDRREFKLGIKWPVLADPTRRLTTGQIKIFERNEIQMHHMSYVRLDIGSKLRNSSANLNFKSKINRLVEHYNSWTPDKPAYLAGREERYYKVKEIDPLFEINI